MRDAITVAFINPTLDARFINVYAKKDSAVQGSRQGLRAAHAAHAARDDELTRQASAEMFVRHRGKGLERPLHDALRADVNPTARGHLPVHHQAATLKLMKVLPVGFTSARR